MEPKMMETKIVQWVQYDNQLKEYNDKMKDKMKLLKEMKVKIEQEIISELDIQNKDKSDLPTFNIPALQTSIKPHVNNSYEGITNKLLSVAFKEYFGSEEESKKLLLFIKSKRKIEHKYSLKRANLMDFND
tara:strand:- start:14 stop:406 length:393 start_codon:yes stop_codon:yes gene_type:complete